jgi:hypothetical protein
MPIEWFCDGGWELVRESIKSLAEAITDRVIEGTFDINGNHQESKYKHESTQ